MMMEMKYDDDEDDGKFRRLMRMVMIMIMMMVVVVVMMMMFLFICMTRTGAYRNPERVMRKNPPQMNHGTARNVCLRPVSLYSNSASVSAFERNTRDILTFNAWPACRGSTQRTAPNTFLK